MRVSESIRASRTSLATWRKTSVGSDRHLRAKPICSGDPIDRSEALSNLRTCVYNRCAAFLVQTLQWLSAGLPIMDKVNRAMDTVGREPASCGWVIIANG